MTLSRKHPRRLAALSALLVVSLAPGLRSPAPAAAATSLTLNGHGWGHGRGAGQYGALGYAIDKGLSYTAILDHYYGGTTMSTQAADAPMSVRMTAVDDLPTIVVQERGFLRTTIDNNDHFALKAERIAANTFRISDGNTCNGPWTARSAPVTASTIDFWSRVEDNDRQNMIQLCEPASTTRWLRGALRAVDNSGSQRTVNLLGTDAYLRGSVPRESPASWGDMGGGKGIEALKTQAVAARSYATSENRYAYAKTCDTTVCQVYKGRAEQVGTTFRDLEDPRSDAAIAQTAGQVRMLSGKVAHAEYSSSTGGYTAGGVFPAVPDDGDAVSINPNHNWTTTIPASTIEGKYQKGTFLSATVLQRNGLGADGGRVTKLHLEFTGGAVDVSGTDFQAAMGLKSDWFTPSQSGLVFGGWEGFGGGLTAAPAIVSWGGGRLDIFVRGTDNSLWHKWYDGAWRGWEPLGGELTSAPAATSTGGNRLDIFVRGTDNGLWRKTWTGSTWTPWESLGGQLTDSPAATASGGVVSVFVRGTDQGIWSRQLNGSWGPWHSLGGAAASAPAATSWPNGRLDVFVRGTDRAVWTNWFDGSRWSSWTSLGGTVSDAPGAASWGNNRLDLLVRGSDNALWHRWWDGSAWSNWTRRGGGLTSGPGAASWSTGRLDVVVRGTDNGLWHTWANS
jgi:SpoIID/LytB domain protein